jgi:hypothetical protein
MAVSKSALKNGTWWAILGLLLAVAVLPLLKAAVPEIFPEGFRNVDCQGVTCPEGQFCQSNQCIPRATRYPNAVPNGNM